MDFQAVRVGITHGDSNGIGYELIIKTLKEARMLDMCTPVIYGSPKVASYHKKSLNIDQFNFFLTPNASQIKENKVNIVDCCDESVKVELGKATIPGGRAAFHALERATKDLKAGHIDLLITAPICKESINEAGFQFPGHTEFLADRLEAESHLMLMVSPLVKVGVVTGHIPLKDVPTAVTKEKILEKIKVLHKSLVEEFAVTNPRIAVLGINPHAGDEGVIGDEDKEIITPALEEATEAGITVAGPFPADGFFGKGLYSKFDAVLAMYHDQGLIPFKTLAFDSGVNFTAGLSKIRVSPGHGTAFDIAGKGVASIESFRNAIYLGIDLFRNRTVYEEMSSNALEVTAKGNRNGKGRDVH